MSPSRSEGHRGQIKDPEHDGRLKENREEGRTKGATPASEARAQGRDPAEAGGQAREHAGKSGKSESRSEGAAPSGRSSKSESSDLKSREYRDEQGNVHHHTRTYQEQHGKEREGGGSSKGKS